MIDLHCHVLPGVDDGVRTLEEAIELATPRVRDLRGGAMDGSAPPRNALVAGEEPPARPQRLRLRFLGEMSLVEDTGCYVGCARGGAACSGALTRRRTFRRTSLRSFPSGHGPHGSKAAPRSRSRMLNRRPRTPTPSTARTRTRVNRLARMSSLSRFADREEISP